MSDRAVPDGDEERTHLERAARVAGIELPEIATPASCHVVVRGFRLHYLDWGREDGPTVLFLHGGALTARTWDLVCLALRKDYRCLALDLRGHGDSEWCPAMRYSLSDHAGDVRSFADALGLDTFAVVGQSLGAFAGLAVAQRCGAGLAALAMVDAGPEVSKDAARRVQDFVLGPSEFDSVREVVARARRFNPRKSEELLQRSLRHNLRELPDGRWTWKYDRRHLCPEEFESLRGQFGELADEIERVNCPVLIVRGEESDVLSDETAAALAGRFRHGSWARVDDAGHTVQGDNPAGLVRVLRRFLHAALAHARETAPP